MTYKPYVELRKDTGELIATLNGVRSLNYVKALNSVGWFSMTLSADALGVSGERFDDSLKVDWLVYIWLVGGKKKVLDFMGFVRLWEFSADGSGRINLTISGPDQNDLLERRIVADYEPEFRLYDSVDSQMNRLVKAHVSGLVADADRDMTDKGVSCAELYSDRATAVVGQWSWMNLLSALGELRDMGMANGEEVHWELKLMQIGKDGKPALTFWTYTNPPGSVGSAVTGAVFGLRWGNLQNPSLTYDYVGEVNFVYGGGPGDYQLRIVQTIEDTDRQKASVWNRREGFVDAKRATTSQEIVDSARVLLNKHRPKVLFQGTLVSNEKTTYGEHWQLGSLIDVEFGGRSFSGLIRNLRVVMDDKGRLSITSKIEFEGII